MRGIIAGLARCKHGATSIEYGLLTACIALAIVGGLQSLGTSTAGMWNRLSARISAIL